MAVFSPPRQLHFSPQTLTYKAAARCASFPWSCVQLSGTLGPHLGDLGVEALDTVSLHMGGGSLLSGLYEQWDGY